LTVSEAEVLTQIQEIVRSLDGIPADVSRTIDAHTNIVRDLRLDSLAVMDFIMALETRFDTIVPLDSLAEIHTIGDLAGVLGASAIPVRR
jgi:acyl carrier protein